MLMNTADLRSSANAKLFNLCVCYSGAEYFGEYSFRFMPAQWVAYAYGIYIYIYTYVYVQTE